MTACSRRSAEAVMPRNGPRTNAQRLADNKRARERHAASPDLRRAANESRRQKRRSDPIKLARENEIARNAARRYREKDPERARRNQWKSMGYPAPTRPEPPYCECCGAPPDRRTLCLDHDHRTGEFRGWLCHRCNSGIGALGDTAAGAALALVYLSDYANADPRLFIDLLSPPKAS